MSQEIASEKPNSAGEMLRQGRLKQRLSVSECAKRTHISPRYLEALEDERWNDLPSESHRIGFLRLYSRFLGVSAEEVINSYEKSKGSEGAKLAAEDATFAKKSAPKTSSRSSLYPASWQQLLALGILLLLVAWVLYHSFGKQFAGETRPYALMPSKLKHPRLVAPKPSVTHQKVRITALSTTWMRVVQDDKLVFEGILPAQATKEWSGNGYFKVKLSDSKAVSIQWNDQPVSADAIPKGTDLVLPLSKQAESN